MNLLLYSVLQGMRHCELAGHHEFTSAQCPAGHETL